MDTTTLLRLRLAKTFLDNAMIGLKQGKNDLSIASSAVSMHDCIDNLFGVIESEMKIYVKRDDNLEKRFDKIDTKYIEDFGNQLPNRSEIVLLNNIRNDVKHNGVLPNTSQVIALISTLYIFCNEVCKQVFKTKLTDISLVSQIKNSDKRKTLEKIEKNILLGNYKKSMEQTAFALFKNFDKNCWNLSPLFMALNKNASNKKTNIFPDRNTSELNLKMLEYGIEPYLFYRLSNLIPKIGYNNLQDKKYIIDYPSLTWHKKNWTLENANFCLDFLTKLFLSQQRKYSGYSIVHKRSEHKVTFIKDCVVLVGFGEEKNEKKFLKDQKLFGIVDGFINNKLTGYRIGLPDHIKLTEISTNDMRYEEYLIPLSSIHLEVSREIFEEMDY